MAFLLLWLDNLAPKGLLVPQRGFKGNSLNNIKGNSSDKPEIWRNPPLVYLPMRTWCSCQLSYLWRNRLMVSITNYIPLLKVWSYGCFRNSNYVSTMSDPPNHADQDPPVSVMHSVKMEFTQNSCQYRKSQASMIYMLIYTVLNIAYVLPLKKFRFIGYFFSPQWS